MDNHLVWVVIGASALSSFFSLMGFALRDFGRVQLEEAFAAIGRPGRFERLERDLKALRLTASFCRSISNLILVVAMLFLFQGQRDFVRTLLAMATAGAIITVMGVAIPHAWASYSGEKILARTLNVMLFFRYALLPIIAVMQAFDMPVRRLSEPTGLEDAANVKQEIMQAAAEGEAEGAVKPEEVRMIESVMEMSVRQAGEIMTPRTDMQAIPVTAAWIEAAEVIVSSGHSRIPVYEGDQDNVIGVLYAKDMLQSASGKTQPADIRQTMRKPFFVPQTKPLDDLLREFKARKVHIAIVLDEYGGTAGLITIEDVLEQIVGKISDEHDKSAPPQMKKLSERSAEVDARMRIVELNHAMSLEIPQEGYDTVAGFIFSELGYIPSAGEMLEKHQARFTVLAADARKISRVKVERLEEPTQE